MATRIDPRHFVDTMLPVVRQCAQASLIFYGNTADIGKAADTSLNSAEAQRASGALTALDNAVQDIVLSVALQHFPQARCIAEENTPLKRRFAGRSAADALILDPIDGTESFIRGVPLYGNLVALVDEHGPAVGVVNLPALDECIWAGRGGGCFADGQPARVSKRTDLSGACVVTSGVDYWPSTTVVDKLVERDVIIRTWGDAYGYALVATGRVDAMVDPVVNRWDVAPMLTILPEAGGVFSDFTGEFTDRGGSALASNAATHPLLLELLSS